LKEEYILLGANSETFLLDFQGGNSQTEKLGGCSCAVVISYLICSSMRLFFLDPDFLHVFLNFCWLSGHRCAG
jgi:hypothetical protein